MTGEATQRGYTIEELWQAVRRRTPLALTIAGVIAVLGGVTLFALPNEYEADATIILEPYRPHPDLITPSVTPLEEDRLKVARQALLASPLLEKIIEQQNLYPALRAKEGMDAAVENLRRHVDVKPDGDAAVVVGFRTDQKDKAASVVRAIAQGYVDANAALRASQAKHVLNSIEKELLSVRSDLDAQEAKLKAFRTEHDGELPEQADENLREADRNAHLLDSAETYVRALEDRLSAVPKTTVTPELEHLAAAETDLIRLYDHAVATESAQNPERAALAKELAGIRAVKAQEVAHNDTGSRERAEIRRELAATRAQASALQQHIHEAQEHAANSARWGTALAVLERDRDMLTDKYKSLMSRRVEAEVALSLEEVNGPASTNVIDPPEPPADAQSPNRLNLMLVVAVLALALGAGGGVLAEVKDETLRTPAQARGQLDVPLLGVLPTLRAHKS